MPSQDITKCANGCDKQEKCHRWTNKSAEYQYYAYFNEGNGDCEHYWDNKDD